MRTTNPFTGGNIKGDKLIADGKYEVKKVNFYHLEKTNMLEHTYTEPVSKLLVLGKPDNQGWHDSAD